MARCDSVAFIERYRGGQGGGEADGPPSLSMGDVRALFGADAVESLGGYRGRGVKGAVIDTDVRVKLTRRFA